ncbi:hypothetical protein JMUB6875_30690 [Nocardia sp. JMUB6875]|uniref:hypothetical protein n=1 Tax=Nocardia sp. JMUB6875 TaxID=3158170 RepID=UPI0032E57BB6
MLNPPTGLTDTDLATALKRHWAITPADLTYRAVGFGTHHWDMTDGDGHHWFVNVDESSSPRFATLPAALGIARRLHEHGYDFVAAPVAGLDDSVVAALGARFAVSLYRYLEGESFQFGEYDDPEHRDAVLGMLMALHVSPRELWTDAPVDDFGIDCRDALDAALDADEIPSTGPYARRTAEAIELHRVHIRDALAHYDSLAALARAHPDRAVLTHGEPHAANTMRTATGYVLIDWESTQLAPPERDLWDLAPGDPSVLAAYTDRTGIPVRHDMLELYRLRWDLTEVALYTHGFRTPHADTANDRQSWEGLLHSLSVLAAR